MNTPFLRLLVLMALSASAFGTTAVTGTIKKLDTTTPGVTAYVRFWLRGTRGNQPRITGTGAIAPQFSGSTFYVDLPADASGNISGTIYSTRDSTGTGAGDIEAGGSYTAVYYGMQIVNGGIPGPEIPVHARSGGTLDIANVSAVSTLPVVAAPTGDTTYARLDGGNTPFSGAVSFASTINATHGGTLGGAFALNFTPTGIYTNTQMNAPAASLIGGLNLGTEYQAAQGNNFTTEGFAAGVSVPNTSTVHQSDGIAGYTNNSSTSTNAVGVYSQARCLASSTACWGANLVTTDVNGFTGITLYGNEVDTAPQNTFASYAGIFGVSSNLSGSLGGGGTIGTAFYAVSNFPGNRIWSHGFETKDAHVSVAFLAGASCASGTCVSQPLNFRSFNGGGAITSSINTNAAGDIILAPSGGQTVKVNSTAVTVTAATGTATVDLASVASGACTADSSDVTLTGASVGDPARVVAATALPAGVWLIGRVTATNTGRFQLCNLSGGAVDRASDTYTISVVK